jgi:hypothetical protein
VEARPPALATAVYNQGRCYQQNNRWEQAISRFREYLRKAKDLSDNDTAEVNRQISDCEASLWQGCADSATSRPGFGRLHASGDTDVSPGF